MARKGLGAETTPLWHPRPTAAGGTEGSPGARRATLSVSELTRIIKSALREQVPAGLHVVGEISNFARAATGHLYFTMKDASSEIRCVMWRSAAEGMRFRPSDGLSVIASGSVDVYEPRGQYQFYVRRLEPRGVGALELAYRQLKERLAREGLFAAERKRPLPAFPIRIAVVTSLAGAAVRDIIKTIRRRFPLVHLLLYDVRVQGDGAAVEIADAVGRINRLRQRVGGIDVLIVGRGGGSLEDLWAFNEEIVARAIYASAIPVVSAVGHEIDFTIADFVADVRAATPTAAAELVVPTTEALAANIDRLAHRLASGARSALDTARAGLKGLERFEWFRDPLGRVWQRHQAIDEVLSRLRLALSGSWSARRSALHGLEVRLVRVRPEAVVARRRRLLSRVEQRLQIAGGRLTQGLERGLARLDGRLIAASPGRLLERESLHANQLYGRLLRAVSVELSQSHRAVSSLETRLQAGSHERILARGFSITRIKRSGRFVADPKQLHEGQRLTTQTRGGEFDSKVVDSRQAELFD